MKHTQESPLRNPLEVKTAIIGGGALGATYGSLLFAMDPASVYLIASGERYNRLRQDGVTVNGTTSRITVIRPEEATPADLLIVAVKYPSS